MDDDSQFGGLVKWALGATGLGAVAAVFSIPFPYGLYVAGLILVLAVLLFGGYFLWRRLRAQREREQFSSAIEAQTTAAPKAISDPTKRADLDRVRQKFQTGLQEFRSRGKDIYKLPWYVIIGESGSGKTEAIRHSGIDFPPGMQDELQGSGGTVNMDWWFTNRAIILDTAGSMLFNEARPGETPEWKEFLRLLKRARPHCPVNGLFLVLSVESLIRDSADTIAQKASRLAQQLDLIQRVLDVRFPVYLLVTKGDLLTGFREFFDNIDDPLLQHQIFGWSNPDPLDAHFRSDLVEEHLRSVATRLRRRRMALIRDLSGTGRLGDTQQFFAATYQLGKGPAPTRRLDEMDAMFALPESVMRLAPRLRRYLETIFVAGEWSAKPVFLRGIYFTSSMREGKALDEAIALATGLPLDQLPEERSWEKNRAFFLRDLFHDKVFRESGLVTRATNTLKLLRRNQLIIFGSAGSALLLLLGFAGIANYKLKRTVRNEAAYWKAGAAHLKNGAWSPAIVSDAPVEGLRYAYGGSNTVAVGDLPSTLVQYNQMLGRVAATNPAVPFIFKPMVWMGFGEVRDRPNAQRRVFEYSVLRPLVLKTQAKMRTAELSPGSLDRHRNALLSLMELQADGLGAAGRSKSFSTPGAPERYLKYFLAYLTETEAAPDPALLDVFNRTYDPKRIRTKDDAWPPTALLEGNPTALNIGLENFNRASATTQTNLDRQLGLLNNLADKLQVYQRLETNWLSTAADPCPLLTQTLVPAKAEVDAAWKQLQTSTNYAGGSFATLLARYSGLATAKSNASASVLLGPLNTIMLGLPTSEQGRGLFKDLRDKLQQLGSGAAENVWSAYNARKSDVATLDALYLKPPTNSTVPGLELRWSLYTNACALASGLVHPTESTLGNQWVQFTGLKQAADQFRVGLAAYAGPFREPVSNLCDRVASRAEVTLRDQYIDEYTRAAADKIRNLITPGPRDTAGLTNASAWLARIEKDVNQPACDKLGAQVSRLEATRALLNRSRTEVLNAFTANLRSSLGFPLAKDSTSLSTLQELADTRKALNGVMAAMQDPVWQTDPSASAAASQFCGKLAGLVNSVVQENGKPAQWDLYFVPPPETAQEDVALMGAFRVVELANGKLLSDLTKADSNNTNSCLLGTVGMNDGLSLSFGKYLDPATKRIVQPQNWNPFKDWALVRFIYARQAQPAADAAHWKFQYSPDPTQKGKLTFEARLKQPLPKPDDWP